MKKGKPSLVRPGADGFRQGSALIIVLCFVVLLTVVVLAMLSRSIFNELLSNASANVTKTDLYGHGAINQIIGDLKQEIVAGSSATVVYSTDPINGTVYRPSAVANAVPYNSGPAAYSAAASAGITTVGATTVWNTMPNLVKQSASGRAFEPYDSSVPNRAAAAPSSTPSHDGRYVSATRWNKPQLLPKASATITTTAAAGTTISEPGSGNTSLQPTASFVVPDWILTTASGGNITSSSLNTSSDMTQNNVSPKSTQYVVGRYAYTIYNEGGLLDANVAGMFGTATDTTLTTAQKAFIARKGPSAFADLTQLPGIANLAAVTASNRPQQVVDSLIGWRNTSTAPVTTLFPSFPTYSFTATTNNSYLSYLLNLSSSFMSVGNTSTFVRSGSVPMSDRFFTSRQQMLAYFQGVVSKNTNELPYLQDAMMYLGTFSRALNQPSYWPDSTRPKVVGPASDGSSFTITPSPLVIAVGINGGAAAYNGGNSAYQLDDVFNPAFKSIRVTTSFTRFDGTTAAVGEPLVKKRFALNRLAWLTCDGPIATDAGALNTSDSNISAIVTYLEGTNVGLSATFLEEGGPTNIKNYFGLTWTASPAGAGKPGGYWVYNHGITSGGVTIVGSLSDTTQAASSSRDVVSAQREPDFFELLKASVNCGSLGRCFPLNGSFTNNDIQDSTVTPQILQLGANIIDETNPTQYPTHIFYTFASGDIRSVYGAMDLPYLASMGPVAYIVQKSTLATPAVSTVNDTPIENSASIDGNTIVAASTSTGMYSANAGTGVVMEVPSVWNPYDVNGPAVPTGIAPTKLRVVMSSQANAAFASWPGTVAAAAYIQARDYYVTAPTTTGAPAADAGPSPYVKLQENAPGIASSWASENSSGIDFPVSSTLYREPTALLTQGVPATATFDPSSEFTTSAYSSYTTGMKEQGSNTPYIGMLIGTFPLRWSLLSTDGTGNYIYTTNDVQISIANSIVRLEYQSGSTWIPYMEYVTGGQPYQLVPVVQTGAVTAPYLTTPNVASITTGSLWNSNNLGVPDRSAVSNLGCLAPWDPRTVRWGMPSDLYKLAFIDPNAGTASANNMTVTTQPSTANYSGTHATASVVSLAGIYEYGGLGAIIGYKQENLWSSSSSPTTDYYMDGDGTVRRAVAAYVSGSNVTASSYVASTTVGLPLAGTVAYTSPPGPGPSSVPVGPGAYTPSTTPPQSQSRPIILHRPYRSVAELGYAFSDTPFRNVDFMTPESGYSALLDTFCINEDYRPDAVAAGRVDLNTKQAPVIQALLNGAYRDENNVAAASPATLTSAEAIVISQDLLKRTTVGGTNPAVSSNSNLSGAQPLANIGDLVGRWISNTSSGTASSPINGAASYDGLSADLALYSTTATGATSSTGTNTPNGNYNIIQRFRETTMRALSDAGQAGTWNLMIDVIAQSGRYPPNVNPSNLSDFIVEGERRYWVHVAIDRITGQVIDEKIEPVNE